ncbi:MAG: hypothetical protein HY088_05650 [Ignavibacteriales bacterium]|nr:hypothetical protein [Ignavibacteriales bacterium]
MSQGLAKCIVFAPLLAATNQTGGSEKQFGDALRVFEVQRERLDLQYMHSWVKQMELESLWKRLYAEAR